MPLKNTKKQTTRAKDKLFGYAALDQQSRDLFGHDIFAGDRGPAAPPIEPIVVRPQHAARLMGASERSIWNLIARRKLKVSRVGNMTMVHVASIRELLEQTAN